MITAARLARSNILAVSGASINDYDGQKSIVPAWKRGLSNPIVRSGSGDYDGGDAIVSYGGYAVDGDLLLTIGWGDGFAIRRLNNDGTLTKLYHNNYALYRDTTSTYNHITGLAIHPDSSTACLVGYNVNGYSMIDYSDLKTGGTTVINNRPNSPYIFNTGGLTIGNVGNSYTNGLAAAGDWLYLLDYDANSNGYKKVPRRNFVTGTEELLDGSASPGDLYAGSSVIDDNAYRGYIAYDEVNDRIYYNYYYNGNITVILDASTSNPKILWCDLGDSGVGDDAYEQGLFLPDPVNNPNKILIGGTYRLVYVDITPCFTGSAPTVLKQFYTDDSTYATDFGNYFRAGTSRQSNSGSWIDRHPTDPWFCPTSSDRGRNMLDGWLDWDNEKIVGLYRINNVTEDTSTLSRGSSLATDYSDPIFRMQSANGTYYWIKTGYGYNGHAFAVYSDSIKNELIGNWEVTYGTFTLSNSGNIDFVNWTQEDYFTPSNCSIAFYVSNNNGTSWEAYSGGIHYFTSSGTQLRCKIVASGQSTKSPYKMSPNYDSLVYGTVYEGIKNTDIPIKIQRFRIKGKKI